MGLLAIEEISDKVLIVYSAEASTIAI